MKSKRVQKGDLWQLGDHRLIIGNCTEKKVWEKLKGWDHEFNYYIDADFCVRARKEGFTVGVVPVELIHSEGEDQLKVRSQTETLRLQVDGHNKFKTKHMDYL